MARRVLALFNDVFVTSAPLNEQDFPAWQKVKGFLAKFKLTPGVVKAAQKTCASDNAC